MRIALCVEYDGAGFCGWQSQASGCAVQDHLEPALARIAGAPVRLHAAGRTDAGVHALGQVAHFDAPSERPLTAWVRGVNAYLPPGVAVLWAHPVDEAFHARFSAEGRRYRYWLLDHPVRAALLHGKVGWYHRPLDAEAMAAAARDLLGEHDFSAFRAAECQARSPVRQLHDASVTRSGDFIMFEFRANGFLHHMVRNIVGTLVSIGSGRHPVGWAAEILRLRDRTRAAPTFDAAGLYFTGADYAPHWGLPPIPARDPGLR